jgi:hypothetical protein
MPFFTPSHFRNDASLFGDREAARWHITKKYECHYTCISLDLMTILPASLALLRFAIEIHY